MSDDHREALEQELAAYETPRARRRRESAAAEHLGRMGPLGLSRWSGLWDGIGGSDAR